MTVTGRKAPQPHGCNACQLSHTHGLASSAFARHYSRNHMLFSLPVGTEMFHFPTFPPHTLYIQMRVTRHHSCWVSPFGNPRITARLTAPRGISQPPTSFIGSWCQGIHRTLINTYNKDARVHCAVLKQHTTPNTHPVDSTELSSTSSLIKHIACSLRTQQCTDITFSPRRHSCIPASSDDACQRSTHEHHRITCESVMALPACVYRPRLLGCRGDAP